jgi:CheY-like chemotaxis protein
VTLADSDEEALLLAQTNQFDLYVIDNWLPGDRELIYARS